MDIIVTQPVVDLSLSVEDAIDLYETLADVETVTPAMNVLFVNLGARLEEAGYLEPDDDDDPDEQVTNVFHINGCVDPAKVHAEVKSVLAARRSLDGIDFGEMDCA